MPPSEPTHGVGPAPRQAAGGGCTCAPSAVTTNKTKKPSPAPRAKARIRTCRWMLLMVPPHDQGGSAADPARMLVLDIWHVNEPYAGKAEAQGSGLQKASGNGP